jgi:hypothetical protein
VSIAQPKIDVATNAQGNDNGIAIRRRLPRVNASPRKAINKEVEMNEESCAELPVEVEAARLAIEWKHLFATELRLAAQRLAVGAKVVTADQYRRALATATERVLEKANRPRVEPADVHRRIA